MLKAAQLTLFVMDYAPKYLFSLVMIGIPVVFEILEAKTLSTFFEKAMEDFWSLIFCPDAWQQALRQSMMSYAWFLLASAKRSKSSTKKRCDREGPYGDSLMALPTPISHCLIYDVA